MQRRPTVFVPGLVKVTFCKGPLGFLHQDPSNEAKILNDNPRLRDKSAPLKQETVRRTAIRIVLERGGNTTDKVEVLGEYVLQFGKYKGKSFRWLLENDVGYAVYIIQNIQKERDTGVFFEGGNSKDSLLSFEEYALCFQEIKSLLDYEAERPTLPASSEDENLVGFGVRGKSTWKQIWEGRADGYAAFIMAQKCAEGTKMHCLQQYLLRKSQAVVIPPSATQFTESLPSNPSELPGMDDDEELEKAMLNKPPSLFQTQYAAEPQLLGLPTSVETGDSTPCVTVSKPPDEVPSSVQSVLLDDPVVKQPVPIPPELLCLVQEPAATQLEVFSTSRTIHSTTATMSRAPLRHKSKTTDGSTCPAFQNGGETVVSRTAVSSVSQQPSPLLQTTGQAASQQAIPRAQSASDPLLYPGYVHDISQWNCSQQQKAWMKTDLESMGLLPGSLPVHHPMKMVSLWRFPPQPELIDCTSKLPSPKYFQLHPFFIWKPENDNLMGRLRNNYVLPCLKGCSQPHIVSAGVGRPRGVVGINGQYYLFASRLSCRACKKRWYADNPQWLEKLPQRFTNILPAIVTYKKAICKTVMDELRRTGKSPNDMANQIMEMMHLKYERAHLAYLLSCQNIMDAEKGLYGQRTISEFLRGNNKPAPFGEYEDSDGWCGVSVSSYYLTDCLLYEYKRQEPAIKKLLQGTFGQALRSDHSRKVAKKVSFTSGIMSSYTVMNENWMILSWIMLQSETDKSLEPMYQGLANRYRIAEVDKADFQWVDRDCCSAFRVAESLQVEHLDWNAWKTTDSIVAQAIHGYLLNRCASRTMYNRNITIKLDLFYCMRRILRECVSERHALYSSFCQFLSAAFYVVDQEDLQRLKDAYVFCGIHPANPTKQHIREHCRTKIPQPDELVKRVEEVFQHFYLAKDPNDVYLFKPSMLKSWRIQRVHILRGCLSDPELPDGILYRYGGTVQLNHVQGEGAKVPVWIPIRGTSQQEGYHFHQSHWVTGTQVSTELFQAQGMTGVARWNYQRLVDLQQPGVLLPGVFDPTLISELNTASKRVTGEEKYPALHLSDNDTGERFGLEYIEPGYRPVVLDWEKHKKKTESSVLSETANEGSSTTVQALPSPPASTGPSVLFQFPPVADIKAEVSLCRDADTLSETKPPSTPSLPLLSSPASARTGPVKTGGRVFVLDHRRWTSQMKEAIDNLINKYHGQKDLLKLVDHDYAAMVQKSCRDPNTMLHPTTRVHIDRYMKYLAKMKNVSSSLNTSQEKLIETQRLWHSLTEGSHTAHVPVVTMSPVIVHPPSPSPAVPLSQDSIERIVHEILEKQQQQHQLPQIHKKRTKSCLSCGQPKSRHENDGSSVHFFYQQGPVRYFYCSHKVFKMYGSEGLTDPKMQFKDFAETEFFQRELDATRKRVEEKGQPKRKRPDPQPQGRICRFCQLQLKQGPNSPHMHVAFPGHPGKYIYCPAKVFSLYKDKGMEREMTWKEFQTSAFYETERRRWEEEKREIKKKKEIV